MEHNLHTLKKRIEEEETIYGKLHKQLHSNPIKSKFSKFMTQHKKPSVLDILKDKNY